MAKASVDNVRLRPDTSDENLRVLREIRAKKKVDTRRQEELRALFDRINAECTSRSLSVKRTSPDKPEKLSKAVHYGPIPGFPSGRWWGIRMDCSRDCIHEPFNESVHEGPFGAVSICTSQLNTHNDVDLGDVLTFTSQEYRAKVQPKDSLVLSYKNKIPIRLVRSYSLSNSYAPKTGYRYDGLYTVVEHWIGVSADSSKFHKFVLARVIDQERPAWSNKVNSTRIYKTKRPVSPILTRSHSNTKTKQQKTKFTYNKVQKEKKVENVSAIVSRQVFKKFVPGSPDSSPRSASSTDSIGQNLCPNTCSSKLCNTNLSIRTNLYDSSQTTHDAKKSTMTFYTIFKKTHRGQQILQRLSQEETANAETSDAESTDNSSNASIANESAEKRAKKVTWADASNSSINENVESTIHGIPDHELNVVDGSSPKKSSILRHYNAPEHCKSTNLLSTSTKDMESIAQVDFTSNKPEFTITSSVSMGEELQETEKTHELSSSIDSVSPDKLVNAIIKEKSHPMAKLLIGNMIGSENKETDILNAYNTLTSESNEEKESKRSKESKVRNKFYISNKSRKNGLLKKQRREIANLTIDAKFEIVTRGSRYCNRLRPSKKRISKVEIPQRKIVNSRRMQSRNLKKEIQPTIRELQPKKPKKRKVEDAVASTNKRSKLIDTGVQCTLIAPPSENRALQANTPSVEITVPETEIKLELVDIDDVKSEPCDVESNCEEPISFNDRSYYNRTYYTQSAFAIVNSVDKLRVKRLRAIGFKPIQNVSPIQGEEEEMNDEESPRLDAEDEYNRYTAVETAAVEYLNDQLHYEDIEYEEEVIENTTETQEESPETELLGELAHRELLSMSTEPLSEEDFDRPWHGWKKVSSNGQTYWTGY